MDLNKELVNSFNLTELNMLDNGGKEKNMVRGKSIFLRSKASLAILFEV